MCFAVGDSRANMTLAESVATKISLSLGLVIALSSAAASAENTEL